MQVPGRCKLYQAMGQDGVDVYSGTLWSQYNKQLRIFSTEAVSSDKKLRNYGAEGGGSSNIQGTELNVYHPEVLSKAILGYYM